MEQQHVIGKLLLEVQLPSRDDAFQLQGRLSNSCSMALMPMLSALLDSWTDPDVLLQIDKLEIDLGNCSQEQLEKGLPELVIKYLQQRYPGIRQESYLESGMQRKPVGEGYFESWLYFLEHGVLPHAAISWTRLEWEAGILATLSTETDACRQCEKLLVNHPPALKRLVLQFSSSFIQNWIRAYSGGMYQPLLQLVAEWETFCYHPLAKAPALPLPAKADFHMVITEWMIREVISPGQQKEHAWLLEDIITLMPNASVKHWLYVLQQMPVFEMNALPLLQQAALTLTGKYNKELQAFKAEQGFKVPYIDNKKKRGAGEDVNRIGDADDNRIGNLADDNDTGNLADDNDTDNLTDDNHIGNLKNIADPKPGENPGNVGIPLNPDAKNQGTSDATGQLNSAEGIKKHIENNKDVENGNNTETTQHPESSLKEIEDGTVLYINNAGLILLHPYLGILFDTLKLREGRRFRDDITMNKAIQLLGYLAGGEDNIPEYDLVFPKLLCGIQPAQPIRRFVPLTAEEKAEADELLLSVISHWNALGSTTPDGLRGNFLMREGKLIWKDGAWQLYVSQQSYDMLLNRLPWGISVVGLSWMPWLIKTVWT